MVLIIVTQFGLDWDVYLLNPEKQYIKIKMADLLPMAFTPQSLLLERDTPTDS
jgi:cytidine deaminase